MDEIGNEQKNAALKWIVSIILRLVSDAIRGLFLLSTFILLLALLFGVATLASDAHVLNKLVLPVKDFHYNFSSNNSKEVSDAIFWMGAITLMIGTIGRILLKSLKRKTDSETIHKMARIGITAMAALGYVSLILGVV